MLTTRSFLAFPSHANRNPVFPMDFALTCGLNDLPRPEGPNGYVRVRIHRSEPLEVNAARWRAGGETALHGHNDSAAIYTVLAGRVQEERWIPDGVSYRYETSVLKAGERTFLPPGCFHRVRALDEAVTLHCYSPAPATTTSAVPPETMQLLEEAKRRQASSPPELVAVTEKYLEGWAERETRANQDSQLRLPPDTIEEMRGSGILAAPMPVELGGWGTSLREAAEALRRIGQRAPATALALVMPLGNAATTRIPAAVLSANLRPALAEGQRWIAAKVLAGKILAVANSEPGSGGELKNTRTRARRGPDGVYRLTGRKSFATFGRDADYFLCAARRPDSSGDPQTGVVDGFFVSREAAGLTVDDRWDPVGMRPTASVGLTLEEAEAEAILGYPGCLESVNARHWSTVLFAAVFLGVGEGALREGTRQVSADAIWARATLADSQLELDAAAGFLEAVAADEAWPLPAAAQERTRRCKTFVARTAAHTALQMAMISGGRCYTPQHPVFRFLCDSLAGPLLRPPLPQAMDSIIQQIFPPPSAAAVAA